MLFDRQRNILIYEGAEAVPAAVACLSSVKRIGRDAVAIPRTLAALQKLHGANLPIPAPMDGYGWPGRHRPWNAQAITANWLVTTPRAFVLSDMGTGKSAAALWAADWLMTYHAERGIAFRALIVAPFSTLRTVWANEIFKLFVGTRKAIVLHGPAEKRLVLLSEPADFYIINYEGLCIGAPDEQKRKAVYQGLAKAIQDRADIGLAVVDEASAYKHPSTRRHAVARDLLAGRPYLWLMTGTPTANGPLDAYGMAKLVNNAHGESFRAYQDRVLLKVGPFKSVPRAGAQTIARKLLQPAIRFAIADCMDLPPCTVQGREVELSAEQKKAYASLKRDAQLAMAGGKMVSAVNEAALRLKLLQLCCGAIYDGNHVTHEIDASPRIKALEELLEQTADKIIIFAPFTNAVELINRKMSCVSREIINGSVTANQRAKIFKAFQDEINPRILIADPRAMAHGLTLTAATVTVWYCPTDSTEIWLQANKRFHRPGQTKPTTVVQIFATPVEREIYRRLETNESMQGALMKLMERI